MKLIEIKNNFAKLYYRPNDVKLFISDFLTVNDGNQKLIAQVISIESTSQPDTSCAVLKFTLDLSEKNEVSAYNGYVPSLNAEVSKINPVILKDFFGRNAHNFRIGEFVTNRMLDLYLDDKFFENFEYIQSDRSENSKKIVKQLTDALSSSLIIDSDGSLDINAPVEYSLCENFKLPVNIDTLNYIYENDLNGLTVEQKAIVQDIVLDIQDYLKSDEGEGYIPFDTLLSVVDEIYKTDKSVGVILFRNKLLRYKQANIFASEQREFNSLIADVSADNIVYLNIKEVSDPWKKETLKFLLNSIAPKRNVFLALDDAYIDKDLILSLKEIHYPVVVSKYNLELANQVKSYARNMIMFTPNEQQKNYPTYNTFLSKLNPDEYIVSGQDTFYTPIIVAPVPFAKPEQNFVPKAEPVIPDFSRTKIDSIHTEGNDTVIDESVDDVEIIEGSDVESEAEKNTRSDEQTANVEDVVNDVLLEGSDEADDEVRDEPDVKAIFESSIEDEIAKDVDSMFYAKGKMAQDEFAPDEAQEVELGSDGIDNQNVFGSGSDVEVDAVFSDEDLDALDEINVAEDDADEEQDSFSRNEAIDAADLEEVQNATEMDDDLNVQLDDSQPVDILDDEHSSGELADDSGDISSLDFEDAKDIIDLENITEENLQDVSSEQDVQSTPVLETKSKVPNIPVYTTEYDENLRPDETIKIAEGNIVYHQKYGRGVVEQIISYGKKTLCSIQFDNIGRRLLDPNLADLKQV